VKLRDHLVAWKRRKELADLEMNCKRMALTKRETDWQRARIAQLDKTEGLRVGNACGERHGIQVDAAIGTTFVLPDGQALQKELDVAQAAHVRQAVRVIMHGAQVDVPNLGCGSSASCPAHTGAPVQRH
jgi:hypothetical protein